MHLSRALTAKLATCILAVTAVITPSFAASVGTVVSDSGLNVRAEASAEAHMRAWGVEVTTLSAAAQVLATLSSGTQVDVLSTTGDGKWHEISYDGTKGFVAGDYLKVTEEKLYGQVVAGPLNVRSGPSAGAEKVDSLSVGAIVEIEELIGGAGGWYQIEGGYVSSDYVAQVDAAVASASGKGSEIAQYAQQYVGYPYVYGGSSPSGFDCSGFVTYVCKHFGYSVNRTASAQMDNGTAVSKSQLQPGDLVFFNNGNSRKRATHVGIYIGGNQFVHASTPTVGVIVSDMDSAYYGTGFVGARRLA